MVNSSDDLIWLGIALIGVYLLFAFIMSRAEKKEIERQEAEWEREKQLMQKRLKRLHQKAAKRRKKNRDYREKRRDP